MKFHSTKEKEWFTLFWGHMRSLFFFLECSESFQTVDNHGEGMAVKSWSRLVKFHHEGCCGFWNSKNVGSFMLYC
jgi:hypothetical protein